MRPWRWAVGLGALLPLAAAAVAVLVVSERGHADVCPACGTDGTDCAGGR